MKHEEKREEDTIEEDTRPVKVIKSKGKEKEDTPLTSLVAYSSDSDEEEIAQSNSPIKYEIPSVIRGKCYNNYNSNYYNYIIIIIIIIDLIHNNPINSIVINLISTVLILF